MINLSLALDPVQQARLHRWALLLDANPKAWVPSFREITSLEPDVRAALVQPYSALEIAYQDEGLRAEGLASASIGAAEQFFGLDLADLEEVLSPTETLTRAGDIAKRIRSAARWSAPGRLALRKYGLLIWCLGTCGVLWAGLALSLA